MPPRRSQQQSPGAFLPGKHPRCAPRRILRYKVRSSPVKFGIVTLAWFAFVVSSALGQSVRYDFDTSRDFSQYVTYKWISIEDVNQVDGLTAKQLTSAVDSELAKKGLTKTDADTADLYIAYQTAIGGEKPFKFHSTKCSYGPKWGRSWYGDASMENTMTYALTSNVYVGQIDLSFCDRAANLLVWRGVVLETLNSKAKPAKKQEYITKAVAKLLRNYPPRSAK
jgi:hypothetical protein